MSPQLLDLIVIGGGINGAAIARDATLRGLSVLLLEADDFASGASGHNGRMIHGGLRYLETGQVGLVRDALKERAILLRVAPHLVQRQTLLIPSMRGGKHPGWMVRLGLLALDVLAAGRAPMHEKLHRDAAMARVPSLRRDVLRGAYVMHDAFARHAERLTIENVLDAAANGAEMRNRCRVTRIERTLPDALTVHWASAGGHGTASARVVVNTTGAWVDELLSSATAGESRLVTKATGTFVVLRRFEGAPNEAVFFESGSDGRPLIMVPWLGNILVGTTDRVIKGPVSAARAEAQDVDYIFSALRDNFEAEVDRNDILYTYSGVRPLPRHAGPSHKASRGHIVHRHDAELSGLVTVLGGKLTTYRSLADEVTGTVFAMLGRPAPKCMTAQRPLPGAVEHEANAIPEGVVSELTLERLAGLYGQRSGAVVKLAAESAELAEVIDPDSGAIAAEFVFSVRHEFARSLSDIMLRRTMLGYHTGRGLDLLDGFGRIASQYLGWSEASIADSIAEYQAEIAATDAVRFRSADQTTAQVAGITP